MTSKSSATIVDVAHKAGVSTATVSRLINGLGPISDDTRERVRDAIDELNYTPKRRRRGRMDPMGMGSAASRAPLAFLRIGAFESQDRSPVTEQLVDALYRNAHAHGRTLTVHHIPEIDPSVDIREIIGNAAGVLLRTSNILDVTRDAVKWLDGLPTVQVLGENRAGRLWVDHVTPDNAQAGAVAADYLIEQGCTRLVFAVAKAFCGVGFERCHSFVNAAHEAGTEVHVVVQSLEGNQKNLERALSGMPATFQITENRMELIRKIADESGSHLGIFIPTDLELALLMPQLQMMGMDFGKDVRVIGCDCESRCLSGLDSMPATMNLHVPNIATRAIRRLLYRIEHPKEPLVRISVAPELVKPEDVMAVDAAGDIPQRMSMVPPTPNA